MGFFSWNCTCCDNSIRSRYAVTPTSDWMKQAVVVFESGDRMSGEYDGYGQLVRMLDTQELNGKFAMYHRACWELAGKPVFSAASVDASDQGYFVGDYHPPCPERIESLEQMRRHESRRNAIFNARNGTMLGCDAAWEQLVAEVDWEKNNATK